MTLSNAATNSTAAHTPAARITHDIGEYTDSALLHLDGAKGMLFLLQSTLEPLAPELKTADVIGILKNAKSLIQWAHDDLIKDHDHNGHVWTTILLWLDGVQGTLSALMGGYAALYDLPNNRIQIAAIHSLQAVISEAAACVGSYGPEGFAA